MDRIHHPHAPARPGRSVAELILAPGLIPGSRVHAVQPSLATARNILVFEPDPVACAALGSWLNRRGYSVALACTPDMAITMIETIVFDVAICDCSLSYPGTRRWLDAVATKPPCPLILVSEEITLEFAILPANLPIVASLTKPIDRPALAAALERTLAPAAR